MATGFEKMEGGLSEKYHDRISPVKRHMDHMVNLGATPGVIAPTMNNMTSDVIKLFAYAAREYMEKYPEGAKEAFVDIAYKNRKQGVNNPRASFQVYLAFVVNTFLISNYPHKLKVKEDKFQNDDVLSL